MIVSYNPMFFHIITRNLIFPVISRQLSIRIKRVNFPRLLLLLTTNLSAKICCSLYSGHERVQIIYSKWKDLCNGLYRIQALTIIGYIIMDDEQFIQILKEKYIFRTSRNLTLIKVCFIKMKNPIYSFQKKIS